MKKLVLTNKDITYFVRKICNDILVSSWKPDYIVGLTRGGLIPAVMISQCLEIPMYTLHVSLRDNNSDNETNCWMSEDAYGYADRRKNILIVDDINDSGATFNWIMDNWKSTCRPNDEDEWLGIWNNNVRFATVVNNEASFCYVKMDYTGTLVDKSKDDVWVDFPWENWWL